MDCSAAADHLSPLADGELEHDQAETVRAHIQKCPRCSRLFQGHVNVKRLVPRMLPLQKAPPGLKSAILDSLESRRRRDFLHVLFARLRAQPFLGSAVAVTVFLAIFASVIWLMNSRRLPPLIREALGYHAEAHQYPLEVASADAGRLTRELTLRLKRKISVPDLRSKRCVLVGFRQCPVCCKSGVEIRYGHPSANLSLFVVPSCTEEETATLCRPDTMRQKRMDGQTYFYCQIKSGRAIFWREDDNLFLVTSTLALPDFFETAREIRRFCAQK